MKLAIIVIILFNYMMMTAMAESVNNPNWPQILYPSNTNPHEYFVGVGSNLSLACTARANYQPVQFAWLQDEKNITTVRGNHSEPPASTKLLEERRYEIAEEVNQNVTVSTLYLYNLKQSDTSLFLCWVDNPAGYAIANFSVTVSNDIAPSSFDGKLISSAPSAPSVSSSYYAQQVLSFFGSGQAETQFATITVGFIVFLALVILLLLIVKNVFLSDRSSKSSTSKDFSKPPKKPARSNGIPNLSSISGPVSKVRHLNSSNHSHNLDSRLSNYYPNNEFAGEDSQSDKQSSNSDTSCRKNDQKLIAADELEGFIEHMRTGIINIDYHTMSPVIQFNNTLKKSNKGTTNNNHHSESNSNINANRLDGQQMHHFASASNASSIPYYSPSGNGTASMTTASSDLSPGSVVGYQTTSATNLYNSELPRINNCDLNNTHLIANYHTPTTNMTSYHVNHSNYHSNHHEDSIPTAFCNNSQLSTEQPLHIPATMYNSGPIMLAPSVQQQRQQQFQHHGLNLIMGLNQNRLEV